MAVTTELSSITYDGNDVAVEFVVPFRWTADAQLEVKLGPDGGPYVTQVLDADYSLSGVGADAGGTLTMTVAPTSSQVLVIERTCDFLQETSFLAQGTFSARTHEDALDYATFLIQQLERRIASLEALASLVPAGSYEAYQEDLQLGPMSDPVTSDFPVYVNLVAGYVPTGCKVVKVEDLTSPSSTHYAPIWVDWVHDVGNDRIEVRYISGLEVGSEYVLTLEITGA